MALHLIGLGLDVNTISADALITIKNCERVYLEGYTVDFPYRTEELEELLECKIEVLDRAAVEGEMFLEEAKETDIALLVYGDVYSATTHYSIKRSCKERGIDCEVYHNASVLTAIGATGLSLYKFGKTASIPNWKEHTNKPTSFMKYVAENKSIGAHSLLLCDIGMRFEDATEELEEAGKKEEVEVRKILVVSCLGTKKQTIRHGSLEELHGKNIEAPYCLVIPGMLDHVEAQALEVYS